jgi:hypothetical protein
MGYIDPDLLHSAMDELTTFVTDNDATITGKGLVTATVKANLATINTDLTGKKGARDKQRTILAVAQQAFADSAATNYTSFSSMVDSVAGAVGKTTPLGQQVLNIRKHVLGGKRKAASQPAPATATSK